jgi:hypothetical protein
VVTREEITYLRRGNRRRCRGYAGRSTAGGRVTAGDDFGGERATERLAGRRRRVSERENDGEEEEKNKKRELGRGRGVCAG